MGTTCTQAHTSTHAHTHAYILAHLLGKKNKCTSKLGLWIEVIAGFPDEVVFNTSGKGADEERLGAFRGRRIRL